MGKIKILGTGLTGMAGSRIVDLLSSKYDFENLNSGRKLDITDRQAVFSRLKSSSAKIVLHLAAKTNVDECEKDKQKDIGILRYGDIKRIQIKDLLKINSHKWEGSKSCFAVNVIGTKNIAEACRKYNKKIVYISTDFVFDGEKEGAYTEEDIPNPINFYGQTKFLGEKIVQKLLKRFLICRLSFLYGGRHKTKQDFVQKISQILNNGQKVFGVADQIFTPTLIDDITFAIDKLIGKNSTGIFHVVGSSSFSPYTASVEIAKNFGYDVNLVKKTYFKDFYRGRALRPKNLPVSNKKLSELNISMKTFTKGLQTLI